MKVFVFPGQGSQFPGMGYDLYKSNENAVFLNDFLRYLRSILAYFF